MTGVILRHGSHRFSSPTDNLRGSDTHLSALNYDVFSWSDPYNSSLNNLKLVCMSTKTMVGAIIITLKVSKVRELFTNPSLAPPECRLFDLQAPPSVVMMDLEATWKTNRGYDEMSTVLNNNMVYVHNGHSHIFTKANTKDQIFSENSLH